METATVPAAATVWRPACADTIVALSELPDVTPVNVSVSPLYVLKRYESLAVAPLPTLHFRVSVTTVPFGIVNELSNVKVLV